MATKVMETAIVLRMPVEILGPGSPYEERRIEMHKEIAPILAESQKITKIDSLELKEQAVGFGQLFLVGAKTRVEFYKSIKTQIDAIKNPILADEHKDIDPLNAEKKRLEGLCVEWNTEQKRLKDEADRKANEAALKQAQEDLLNQAVELDLSGEHEQAEMILETPVYAAPVVTQGPAKTRGEVEKYNYSMVVVNQRELIQAVLDGKALGQCITINESYLNSRARTDKEGFSIPGCELKRTPKVNFRS